MTATTTDDSARVGGGALTLAQRVALGTLWLFLLSPMLVQPLLGAGRGRLDGLLVFNLVSSLLWAGVLHFGVRRPFVLHALMAPLYVATAVDLFLIAVFGNRLSSGYISIMLTDYTEAGEFLVSYARPVGMAAAALLLVYLPGLLALRGVRLRHPRWVALWFVIGLACVYAALTVRGVRTGSSVPQSMMDLVGKEMSSPVGGAFQTGLAMRIVARDAQLQHERLSQSLGARQVRAHPGEVYVWVVGESSRPQNWSLFGYARPTTPRLSAMPGVIALKNVITTAPHTSVAVPSMLSLRPITDWNGILRQRSIVSAFNEAGFSTVWLSAQEADAWAGTIPQVAAEAKRRRYFDRAFDGALLDELRSTLDSAPPGQKLFIVLHSKGSHFEYARRYPAQFARFHSGDSSRRGALVDSYDNSVLYTDWFLSQVIDILAAHRPYAALVYASDHGENLLDDSRQLFGHALANQYDLPTAALVWLSDAVRRSEPAMADAAARNAAVKLSLSNLPQSMLDLAGIEASGFDRSQSIFNPALVERPRWYMVRGELRPEPAVLP